MRGKVLLMATAKWPVSGSKRAPCTSASSTKSIRFFAWEITPMPAHALSTEGSQAPSASQRSSEGCMAQTSSMMEPHTGKCEGQGVPGRHCRSGGSPALSVASSVQVCAMAALHLLNWLMFDDCVGFVDFGELV